MAKKAVKKPAPKAAPKKAPAKSAPAKKVAAKPAAKAAAKPAAKPVAKAAAKPALKAAPIAKEKPALTVVPAAPVEGKKVNSRQSLEAATVEAGKSADVAPAAVAQAAAAPVAPVRALKAVKATRASKVDKGAGADDEKRWQDLHEKYSTDKAATYDMKATFEAGKAIQHKILGWGWILSNENDRLEVLFKDGKRILISNYNPNR